MFSLAILHYKYLSKTLLGKEKFCVGGEKVQLGEGIS